MTTTLGPIETPRCIFNLIIATVACSIGVSLLDLFFALLEWYPLPSAVFDLSRHGLSQWFIWQPLTYLFVFNAGEAGITFPLLITIFFEMYLLWTLGTSLVQLLGSSTFVWFYVLIGALTGLLTVLIAGGELAGAWPSVLAVIVAWTLLNPEHEVWAFFLVPVKAKWLTTALIGAILLVSLTHLDTQTIVLTLLTTFITYLWSAIAWGAMLPFAFTSKLDNLMTSIRLRFRTKGPEIYDLATGKSRQTDDEFVDAMLEKISRYGESTLTWSERQRMKKISERKMSK